MSRGVKVGISPGDFTLTRDRGQSLNTSFGSTEYFEEVVKTSEVIQISWEGTVFF